MTSDKTRQLIKDTIEQAIYQLTTDYQENSLSSIYIAVDKSSGILSILDDEENIFAENIIPQWRDVLELNDSDISTVLLGIISQLDNEEAFIPLQMHFPITIYYTDENFDTKEELLVIASNDDSDADMDLLASFDKQFDDFLDNLLN